MLNLLHLKVPPTHQLIQLLHLFLQLSTPLLYLPDILLILLLFYIRSLHIKIPLSCHWVEVLLLTWWSDRKVISLSELPYIVIHLYFMLFLYYLIQRPVMQLMIIPRTQCVHIRHLLLLTYTNLWWTEIIYQQCQPLIHLCWF